MKSAMLILVAIVVFFILCLIPAFIGWRKKQRKLREKILSRLSNRSDRLYRSLLTVPERYLKRETRLFIVEHLLSVITQLERAHYQSEFVLKQADLLGMLDELKLKQRTIIKDRVSTQEQLEHTQNTLQFMLRELRSMSDTYGVSKTLVKHHIMSVRYSYSLAHSDLLVRQARDDLDNDRKNRALEKYRIALSVIEKNSSVGSARKEIVRLQSMIQEVENALFSKGNKPELKAK